MKHADSPRCHWGILGAATIARKNWQALRLAGNAQLVAVASRDLSRAQAFIADCQAACPWEKSPRAMDSYEQMLADPSIDAVYIPLPTGLRKPWVIRAAEAGKHVLAEKPVGTSVADVEAMVAACRQHNVQFMDGVMFMHSARLAMLRQTLDDEQSVGRIRRIASQFSFNGGDEFRAGNIRVDDSLEPYGCLGDLGWYTIRFALWVMKYQLPARVWARTIVATPAKSSATHSSSGVPLEFSAEMEFPDGVTAGFYCSFQTENQQWVNISGDRGYILIRDFVLPFYGAESSFDVVQSKFHVHGCDFDMIPGVRRVTIAEYSNSAENSQETLLIRRFSELALSGRPDTAWGDIAIQTQRVMDACLTSARLGGQAVEIGTSG